MAQKGVTVANSAFPLYAIHMIGDQHVMIAGGGGQAKTGVGNAIVSSIMSLAVVFWAGTATTGHCTTALCTKHHTCHVYCKLLNTT